MNARRLSGTVPVLLLVSIAALTAFADDAKVVTIRSTVTIPWFADGSAGPMSQAWPDAVAPAELRTFSSAIPMRNGQWRTNTKSLPYDFTPDAFPHAAPIKKVMGKYLNKRFGNGNVPKFSTTNLQMPVKSLAAFGNNLFEYRTQFAFDDHNQIVMTQDDQFFKNTMGQLENPSLVASTHLYLSAMITKAGNRWVGTYFLEDADVWLRSDFFNLTIAEQQNLLSAAFRAALGYQKTVCTYDFHANVRTISSAMFKNNKSPAWALAREFDNMFYTDAFTGPAPAAYLDAPRVVPLDNAVLDLKEYKLPDTNPANPDPTVDVPALFLTNLKAFESGKSLSITFTAVPAAAVPAPAKKIKILTISGSAYDYPKSITINGQPTAWYPTIHLNYIMLGQQEGLTKLRDAIAQYGTPLNVEGASFAKALKFEIAISGYLTETGAVKKLVRKLYITDSSL